MILKIFVAFLKFNLPSARFLNFPKISASFLIRPFLIIGYCMYSWVPPEAQEWVISVKKRFPNKNVTGWKMFGGRKYFSAKMPGWKIPNLKNTSCGGRKKNASLKVYILWEYFLHTFNEWKIDTYLTNTGDNWTFQIIFDL